MANDWREVVEEVLALQDDPDIKTSPGPALQWYPAQWLGDSAVQLMSMEARGVHHHLLMTAWKGFAVEGDAVPCSVPADVEMLKAICLHPAGWESIWPQVARGWRELRGRLWNLGLCREYLRQMAKRRSSKCSADARWRHSQTDNDANAPEGHANAPTGDAKASNRECSSVFSLQSSTAEKESRDPSGLVGDPDGSADDTPDPPADPKRKAAKNGNLEEMRWRIEETWAAHLGMREYYWQDVEFAEHPPGSPPTLTPQRRKLIGEALKRHDKGLLKAEDRERWKTESKARAAGIGIFLDPWCTARAEGNILAEGGKRYLEPERAWKIKSGVDQVERFAELYFQRKERRRGTS